MLMELEKIEKAKGVKVMIGKVRQSGSGVPVESLDPEHPKKNKEGGAREVTRRT